MPIMSSSTAIVTGAAGFIGSALSQALLSKGMRVVGVDNFDPFYRRALKQENISRISKSNFSLVEVDICDNDAISNLFAKEKPDTVYHIAAMAGVPISFVDPQKYAKVNLEGLVSVLEAARQNECKRFIFASSSSVYGNNSKVPFAEDDRVDNQISPYAATKRSGELICYSYSHRYNLPIACLRFFTVYGPAQRPDLAIMNFMKLIAVDEAVPKYGDGSTSRDYTYIDDIISGVLAANERIDSFNTDGITPYRIWNLGGSSPVTLNEMIDSIGRVVGKTPQINQLPMQPGDVTQTYADLTRSEVELDYKPTVEFEDGLVKQWEWLKSATAIPVA